MNKKDKEVKLENPLPVSIEKAFTMQDAFDEFKKDFPEEAYDTDTSRGFALTSLKAQYMVERLNDTLYSNGVGGWYFTGEYQETDNGVLYFGQLTITVGDESVIRENVGFGMWPSRNSNDGDAYKSAATDCLSKCASHLGIGNDVYKGLIAAEVEEDDYDVEDDVEDEFEATRENADNDSDEDDYDDYDSQNDLEASADDDQESEEEEPKLRTRKKFNRGSRFSSGSRLNK